MDLLTATFARWAGLSTLDLTVRFLPTLFHVTTCLSVFCFGRAWLKSGFGAALFTFLVMFAEDFSFVPGLITNSADCWSAQYFGVPTTFSLFFLNPMLPALGLMFAGLFCLLKYLREGRTVWLVLTAVHFAVILEFKVFPSLLIALCLAIVTPVYLLIQRDARFLKVLVLTGMLLAPLLLPMLRANSDGGKQAITLDATLIPSLLKNSGLGNCSWAEPLRPLYAEGTMTLPGWLLLFLIVIPGFVVGSFGVRLLALGPMMKNLVAPTRDNALRFFLTIFVVAGVALSLSCAVASTSAPVRLQYNNACWFCA